MSQLRDSEVSQTNGIWSAAERGDASRVKKLLEDGKDVNGRNCLGCTPLLYACGSGNLETVCSSFISAKCFGKLSVLTGQSAIGTLRY